MDRRSNKVYATYLILLIKSIDWNKISEPDKKEVIKEVPEDYNEEGYTIPKEINKSIRLFSNLKTNDDWKQTNTKVKAFYVKALKFLERANKEIHKKVYNASPDLFKKYYDKNKNNQIVLGRGLEMDSIN